MTSYISHLSLRKEITCLSPSLHFALFKMFCAATTSVCILISQWIVSFLGEGGNPLKDSKPGIPALSLNYTPNLTEALSRHIRNDSQVQQSFGKIPESSLVILRTGTVPLCTYNLIISCFTPFLCVSHGLAAECKSSVKVKLFLSVWTLSTLCSQIFY